jgi:hypothetical protein
MDSIKLVSITNNGYKDVTLNCIISLKNINFDLTKVVLYCMDDICFDFFSKTYPELIVKRTQLSQNNLIEYCKSGWKEVTLQKISAVYEELLLNEYIILFDGDIVFRNIHFLSDLWSRINSDSSLELVAQNEFKTNNLDANYNEICSGFYIIKSTANTKNIFNINNKTCSDSNDQTWLNRNSKKLNHQILPNELYPNGRFFYDNHHNISPYIVHFNFVMFPQKKSKMKSFNMWFI